MVRGSLLILALLSILVRRASCWWDYGHMLVAEVARQQLNATEVAALNGVLSDWARDFPNSSDVVSVAPWPDMIKCKSVSPFCRNPKPEAIGLFSAWHFDDKVRCSQRVAKRVRVAPACALAGA